MSTPFGITWIGARTRPYVETQQLGLGRRERDHRPVRATAIADAVAQSGEQVHRVAHHAPDVVAARAHGGLQQPVVDVDVAGHDVVVRDRDGVGACGEESSRSPRADRAEPDDVACPSEMGGDGACARVRFCGACRRQRP